VYGDKPYLYGALLSSINVLRIGSKPPGDVNKAEEKEGEAVVYEEGADGDGEAIRKEKSIPSISGQRQKYFLTEAHRKDFEFEAGREYKCDFFNPYLDFNEFALKIGYGLPAISIIGNWDGQPLRYVVFNSPLSPRFTHSPLSIFAAFMPRYFASHLSSHYPWISGLIVV
jgi:hypothetical protein